MGTLVENEGYRYILTVTDYFTKWFRLILLKKNLVRESARHYSS